MENSQEEQLEGLFNPQTEVAVPKASFTDYRPSAAKGTNNVYQSIIRFVPWYKDAKHGSIREKWNCWLVDPLTEKGRTVDCPSSVGEPSVLQDMYFKCKNSDNAMLNSKMKIFSRRHTFASLIQIIKDEQHPELEGKIIPWKYGVKIWDKIDAELKPVIGDKHDPFDILQGKAFALIITKVSGYNNYDQSKFLDKKIPLLMPVEGKNTPINESTDKQSVFNFVKTESPDLADFHDYKPWDQSTHDYVNNIILQVTGEAVTPTNFAAAASTAASDSAITASTITMDDLTLPDVGSDPLAGLDLPTVDAPPVDDTAGISGSLDDALKGLI
jgi:hypothetical protein